MTRILGLVRVSTEHQSAQQQRERIEAQAAQDGVPVEILDEGDVSGALDESERPKLAEVMAAVRNKEIARLYLAEWSRLGRDTISQLTRALALQRAGVQVVVLDDARRYDLDDPDDLLLFFILAWKDHKARLDTKKRTRAAFKKDGVGVTRSVRNGKKVGRPSLIWSPEADAKLLALVGEGKTLRQIDQEALVYVEKRVALDVNGARCTETHEPPVSWRTEPVPAREATMRARLAVLRATP